MGISFAIYREEQSGTFFLGQFRFGAYAIFREAGAGAVGGGGVHEGRRVFCIRGAGAAGFRDYRARPATAFYHPDKGEYFLMYDEVRSAANPAEVLLDFCQSTYEAAAITGKWDRVNLERQVSTASKAVAD